MFCFGCYEERLVVDVMRNVRFVDAMINSPSFDNLLLPQCRMGVEFKVASARNRLISKDALGPGVAPFVCNLVLHH